MHWFKRHPVLGLCSTLLAAYLAYELVTRTFVYSRDGYVTSDIIYIAPQVRARWRSFRWSTTNRSRPARRFS